MKIKIQISPVTYSNHFMSIAFPHTPILIEVCDVKNKEELLNKIIGLKAKHNDIDAFIYLKPLSRKFNGFDKFKKLNLAILEIRQ